MKLKSNSLPLQLQSSMKAINIHLHTGIIYLPSPISHRKPIFILFICIMLLKTMISQCGLISLKLQAYTLPLSWIFNVTYHIFLINLSISSAYAVNKRIKNLTPPSLLKSPIVIKHIFRENYVMLLGQIIIIFFTGESIISNEISSLFFFSKMAALRRSLVAKYIQCHIFLSLTIFRWFIV